MEDVYTAIYEKLSTLQWLMKRRQMLSQAQSGPFADPTRGQGRILAMLKIQPEIKTRELCNRRKQEKRFRSRKQIIRKFSTACHWRNCSSLGNI